MTRNIVRCNCEECGSNVGVWYDVDLDAYLCKECIIDQPNEEEEEALFI